MTIMEENWNYKIDLNEIEASLYGNFELEVNNLCKDVLLVLEEGFISKSIDYQTNLAQTYDEELKNLVESNKSLKQKIDIKIKTLTQQQTQYETFKKDQKLLTQEIKETHEAFLMAKKCYKKILKMYFSIESRKNDNQVIFVQFFTESKKDNENYSVRLIRNIKNGKYELLSVNPKLKCLKELQKEMCDTNNVPGVLCALRQAFLALKDKKSTKTIKTQLE
ncbi:kinetochore protein Spc25-like [Danaus plexippus]|uniref:kinetochore protein Spc25-like n=1 Tax=Danaus plexippus TaxID=13037 RepID=UPI002AAFA827|nr:kinetochore protein Spc25-like [Danaus plexippus]